MKIKFVIYPSWLVTLWNVMKGSMRRYEHALDRIVTYLVEQKEKVREFPALKLDYPTNYDNNC